MTNLISGALHNFTLIFLVLGCVAAVIGLVRRPVPLTRSVLAPAFARWFIFSSMGVSDLFNGIVHAFLHASTATFIGWADSPFQLKVGAASFGFGLVGVLAPWRRFGIKLAAVLGPAVFFSPQMSGRPSCVNVMRPEGVMTRGWPTRYLKRGLGFATGRSVVTTP